MIYEFGTAANLYAQHQHPRIAFGPADLDTLRTRIATGDGARIMTALRRKAAILADEVLAAPDAATLIYGDKSHNSLAARLGSATDDLGIVALLSQDDRAMAAMLKLFDTVIAQPLEQFRHARVSAGSLSLAYDYLHELLPAPVRQAFCRVAVAEIRQRLVETRERYLLNAASNLQMAMVLPALECVLAIEGEPGVPTLVEERDWLLCCLEASIQTAIGPQGYPEEDTGYGTLVTARLVQYVEWVRRAGLIDLYQRCPHLLRFGQAILHIVLPWGEDLHNTGDHGDDFGEREFVLARLAAETSDPTLLWLLGSLHYHHGKVHPENRLPDHWVEVPLRDGFRMPACWRSLLVLPAAEAPVHPGKAGTPTAFMDTRRGIVSFRDSWSDEATAVIFDGSQRSPAGQGHAHSNAGHFILSARGDYFAIGPGRYQNDQDQQSVVLVDGKSGHSTNGAWRHAQQEGLLTRYAPGDFVDYAAVDASHQYQARWARRHLGLVKGHDVPGYVWTVEDINKADDWAEFWWQLQASPENTITIGPDSATIQGWRRGNYLDVHVVSTPPAELTWAQDLSTSSSYAYLSKALKPTLEELAARYPRPAEMVHGPVLINPRLLVKVKAPCGRFMSLMLPRDQAAPPARVEALPCLRNSLAMRVTFEEVEDTIIFAYEHRMLEAAGIVARGDWCVVRRHRTTGAVLAQTVYEGTMLALPAAP